MEYAVAIAAVVCFALTAYDLAVAKNREAHVWGVAVLSLVVAIVGFGLLK